MNDNIILPKLVEPALSPGADTLVAEAHHRVGNSLALIMGIVRMKARTLAKQGNDVPIAGVNLLFAEVEQRLEAVGRLHSRLTRLDGPPDLSDYLRDIAGSAVAALAVTDGVRLHFDMGASCVLPPRTAALVGLAVNELVMNAIKFAHPAGVSGHLLVGCNRRDRMIVIDVIDDGVGFPEGFDPETDGEFGLRLVRSLAGDLKARLVFTDTGVGVHAQLSMPT